MKHSQGEQVLPLYMGTKTHDAVLTAAHRGIAARLPDSERATVDADDLFQVLHNDAYEGERSRACGGSCLGCAQEVSFVVLLPENSVDLQ